MTVVLVPIVHKYGADGVLTVGLIAGVMLLALAFARAGAAMAYVPARSSPVSPSASPV